MSSISPPTLPNVPPPASSGTAWQQYVNRLLTTHFRQLGHQYIEIPDKSKGDGGLEGFSTSGEAFQAYADEGSVSTEDRARKQKLKVTRDIKKLVDPQRQEFWKALLQNTKLSHWQLVVPIIEDKSVLVHAREKAEAIRKMKLPYLTKNFQASVIAADAAFPVAAKTLLAAGASYMPDGYCRASPEDLQAFASAQGEQIIILDGKLQKLPTLCDTKKRHAARDQLLMRLLDAENLLERLKSTSPDLWEQIIVQRHEHAKNLEMRAIFDSSQPQDRVSSAMDKFCNAIMSLTGSTASTAADTIANGAIGLWLLECPLDFPEKSHA